MADHSYLQHVMEENEKLRKELDSLRAENVELPSVVQVGPYTYRVTTEKKEPTEELFGECDVHNQVVYLYPGQARDSMADSLLHEILHACWACTGMHDGKYNEEQVVRGLTTWLLLVLRDNPELVEYLTYEQPAQVAKIVEQFRVVLEQETSQ
jgi:hypothetical protein